ncbi:hypothetical protein ACVWXS_000557 [Lysinibacillus sp. TE18511]
MFETFNARLSSFERTISFNQGFQDTMYIESRRELQDTSSTRKQTSE